MRLDDIAPPLEPFNIVLCLQDGCPNKLSEGRSDMDRETENSSTKKVSTYHSIILSVRIQSKAPTSRIVGRLVDLASWQHTVACKMMFRPLLTDDDILDLLA